jgi:hypothetical protein
MIILRITVFWVLYLVALASHAVTATLDESGTNVIELKNLDVGGVSYDVLIEEHLVSSASDGRDIFSTKTDAEITAEAIRIAIQNTAAISVGSSSVGCDPFQGNCTLELLIPYSYNSTCQGVCGWGVFNDSFVTSGSWTKQDKTVDSASTVEFAKFIPASTVPVPPAVFLFGSGIVALAGISRRPWGSVNSG